MNATVTCQCGKVIEITPYLNADLALIADSIEEQIRKALALTDPDSPEFRERFGLSRPQYTAGWNVVEAIREVLLP